MTSEIRANTLKNRVGLGTVSFTNTGPVVSGIVTIANSTAEGVRLEDNAGVGGSLKITTPTGYVSIGAGNATFAHLQTDRGIFYFNKRITVNEGIISSYDEDLVLQSPMNTNRMTINKTTGLVSIVNDLDVDGHTNLDNVSIAGVVTATGAIETTGSELKITGAEPRLTFTDTDNNPDFQIWANAQRFSIYDNTNNATRLRINSGGEVLIGTETGTGNNLTVQDAGTSTTAGGNIVARFQSNGSGRDATIQLSDNTAHSATISMLSSALVFKQSGTETFRIAADGEILVPAAGANRLSMRHTSGGKFVIKNPTAANLSFGTNNNDEEFVIANGGNIGIGIVNPGAALDVSGAVQATSGFKTAGHPIATYASFTDISGGSYATRLGSTGTSTLRSTQIYGGGSHIATFDGVNTRLGINITVPTAKLHVSAAYNETGTIITGGAVGYNDALQVNTANGWRRFTVAGDGTIYGPSGGRKNWFDNGSFDCRGGRRANTSVDYGNHHNYGWVTDRFQSRNAVQWSRSTNVPTGKGFSYSIQSNSAGGTLMQAVELPDYGDMGVFEPGSYWCVSVWSTGNWTNSTTGFGYDLGPTGRTGVTRVLPTSGSSMASTGETAAGTSTGTFTRYYSVFEMPSSIQSTSTSIYFTMAASSASYTTGFQLERVPTSTSKPTAYEHVHPSVTINRCRRYAYQCVNSRMMNGYKRHDGQISWTERFPVPPTHMPSGSNQSVPPYGIHLHDGGLLSNFQSVLQNPGVNSVQLSEFDYRSGRFLIVGSTSYSSTHVTVPAWESQEFEIMHGHF